VLRGLFGYRGWEIRPVINAPMFCLLKISSVQFVEICALIGCCFFEDKKLARNIALSLILSKLIPHKNFC
jgi:hypothetical protein